jgi:hypothetical protein
LVVGAWPAVTEQLPPAGAGGGVEKETGTADTADSALAEAAPAVGAAQAPAQAPAPQTHTAAAQAPVAQKEPLSQKELDDPHCVDFIESNDVLDAEINAASEALAKGLDEDERFAYTLRLQLLQTKMHLLVYAVQTEALSLPDYLDKLRLRVRRDTEMALAFKAMGDKESITTALSIMKRMNVMKQEISNAEDGGEGEEG